MSMVRIRTVHVGGISGRPTLVTAMGSLESVPYARGILRSLRNVLAWLEITFLT